MFKFLVRLIILVLVIVLAAMLYARAIGQTPTIMGYTVCAVKSGSMEPEMPVDSIWLFRSPEDPSQLSVGDIVLYLRGSVRVTHRIVQVGSGGYQTQGDANNAPDPELLTPSQVMGVAWFRMY